MKSAEIGLRLNAFGSYLTQTEIRIFLDFWEYMAERKALIIQIFSMREIRANPHRHILFRNNSDLQMFSIKHLKLITYEANK